MKNIENISQHIETEGVQNMLIHSIPDTTNWLICHKTDKNQWTISLCNPTKNILFNLCNTDAANHLKVWESITRVGIENKNSQEKIVKQYKAFLKKFIINNSNIYANIFKKTTDKKPGRTQKSSQKRVSQIRHNAELRINKPENHIHRQKEQIQDRKLHRRLQTDFIRQMVNE